MKPIQQQNWTSVPRGTARAPLNRNKKYFRENTEETVAQTPEQVKGTWEGNTKIHSEIQDQL
jgi:hypothetical protein